MWRGTRTGAALGSQVKAAAARGWPGLGGSCAWGLTEEMHREGPWIPSAGDLPGFRFCDEGLILFWI
ncbi:hypothetical protein Droror1_Dr00002252 [Drosera rotundifolia]